MRIPTYDLPNEDKDLNDIKYVTIDVTDNANTSDSSSGSSQDDYSYNNTNTNEPSPEEQVQIGKRNSLGYNDVTILATNPQIAKELIDKINNIPDGRRATPPSYDDYILYDHRNYISEYNLRIGDSLFIIPPDFIQVKTISSNNSTVSLRQKNSVKVKTGYVQKEIVVNLYLNGFDQINGFEVESPFSYKYYVDGLRPLLAQFKCSPFLPIENELLNMQYNIHSVALQSISVSTMPGFPECLKAMLVLREFNATPYIEAPNFFFDEFIDWDLFRFYYQRLLRNDPSVNIHLKPLTERLNGKFSLSIIDSSILDGTTPNLFDSSNYTKVLSNEDNVYITEMNFNYSNILPIIQLSNEDSPTMQYLGGMDTVFNVTLETTDKSILSKIQMLIDDSSELARSHKDYNTLGYIKFDNELCSLAGTEYVIISEIISGTVEEFPDLYKVDLQCISFDIAQNKTEDLYGFKPFDGIGTKEQAISQDLNGIKTKIQQDLYVEKKLLDINMYEDLNLPKYSEVNNAIKEIIKFRAKYDLTQIEYTKYPEEYTVYPNAGTNKAYNVFVDPDFYVFYPMKYADITNDAFKILKGPSKPNASSIKYMINFPINEDDSISDTGFVENASNVPNVTGNTFIDLALSRLNPKCGYIWGASGETCTWDFIYGQRKKFTRTPENEKLWHDEIVKQWVGKQVFDCSGLVSWCLRELGLLKGRLNVAGLRGISTVFNDSSKLQAGDLCFVGNGHVGIYVGNNTIVEAMGTSEGVVTSTLKKGIRWSDFGRVKSLSNISANKTATATQTATQTTSQTTSTNSIINNPTDGEWPNVNKWNNQVLQATKNSIFDPNLIKAIIWVESKGNPIIKDPVTGTHWGLMQCSEDVATMYGFTSQDRLNPLKNITMGVKYLEHCYGVRSRNLNWAIVGYNAGPYTKLKTSPYLTTVWNAYKHISPQGTGFQDDAPPTNSTPESYTPGSNTNFSVYSDETFGGNVKDYVPIHFGEPIIETSPLQAIMDITTSEDINNIQTRFKTDDGISRAVVDERMYAKKARLLRAYPTYLIMFLDSNDNWLDGRKLWTNYYLYKSVIDISINQEDGNPVHTAVIRLNNSYHNLNTAPTAKNLSEILENDEEVRSRLLYKWFGIVLGGPKLTDDVLKYKNELFEKINVMAGCRMHVRLGYGSNPLGLNTMFNGVITEVDAQDIVTIIGESDGAELVNQVVSINKEETNRLTKLQKESSNIIANLLTVRDNWFFNSLNNKWCEKNKYGIEHFGLFIGHALDADSEYDMNKNIYRGVYSKHFFVEPSFLFDGEENIEMYIYNRTPWDIMQMAAQNTPEFVCQPVYHGFESRIFYGIPDWIYKYRYDIINDKVVEFGKNFAQFHFIGSLTDIIDNQVVASSKDLKTNCIGSYSLAGKIKTTPLLYADRSIDWDKQKVKLLDSTVMQDYLGPDWLWEKLGFSIAQNGAIRIALSNLVKSFEDMYKGSVITLGNPSIKPNDYIYIDDIYTDMHGLSFVKEVTHTLSIDSGFITDITPGLITTTTVHNSGKLNTVKTLMCFSLACGTAYYIKGVGILAMKKTGKLITGTKGLFKTKVNLKAITVGTKTKTFFKTAWSGFKEGKIFTQFNETYEGIKTAVNAVNEAENVVKAAENVVKAENIVKAIKNTEKTVKVTVGGIKAGAAAAGTAAFPIVGTIISYIVTSLVLDTFLNFIVNQFAWNNCINIIPLYYKNKPFVSGVNGQTKLIPGSKDNGTEYQDKTIAEINEILKDVVNNFKETLLKLLIGG